MIFKYAGGKRRILHEILPRLPIRHARRFVEPFVGGGAVFFAARLAGSSGPAWINDAEPAVAATYLGVCEDPEGVVTRLQMHAEKHETPEERGGSRVYYYRMRGDRPPIEDAPRFAAWFIYMNRAGFNGLWRVNRKGENNVPFGDGRPFGVNAAAIQTAASALQDTLITSHDFSRIEMGAGDVAYCDPPYLPASATSSFTGYTRRGFGPSDQLRLASWCRRQADQGASLLLSNAGVRDSLTAFLDRADEHVRITAPRVISCKGGGRQPVPEYLFRFGGTPWPAVPSPTQEPA